MSLEWGASAPGATRRSQQVVLAVLEDVRVGRVGAQRVVRHVSHRETLRARETRAQQGADPARLLLLSTTRTDRRGSGWTEAYATRTQERARRGGATRRADHQEGRRGEATGTPPPNPTQG